MNKMKKFASIATAVLMTACMAAPMTMSLTSSAVDVEYNMSLPSGIPTDASIANLKAVKIFDATYDSNNNVLNITGWATGVTLDTITAKLATGSSITTELSGITDAVDVAAKLAAWEAESNGHAKVEEFAKAAAEALKGSTGVPGTFDKDNNKATFEDLGTGYYVVLCDIQKNTTGYDATSLGMLTVTGAGGTAQIGLGEAKVGLPKVMKKVYENQDKKASEEAASIGSLTETDTKWNDVADYNIGDKVPFKLYGTMPQDIDKYDHYYYKFTDTLGKEFNAPTSVTIKVNGDTVATAPTNSDIFTSITADSEGNTVITVTFEDIKEVIKSVTKEDATASDIITVEYEAVLNTSAVIGLPGQENKVDLTYSNNPNVVYIPHGGSGDTTPGTPDEGETGTPETPDDGTPDNPGTPGDNTGKTPEDKVIVFTYELDVTKTFLEANGTTITDTTALKSAVKFELRKDSENGTAIKFLNNMPSTETEASAVLSLDASNQIILKGLDDGTYYLVETNAPTGFNKANPMKIVITAGTVNNQTWSGTDTDALKSFAYTIGDDEPVTGQLDDITKDGIAEATVQNKKGSTLPGTGGIGTTLFYVGGGAMVAVAGVFLITKKRMGKKED